MEKALEEQVVVGSRPFVFSLCRKREAMGRVPVDHWWMPVPALYDQRGNRGRGRGNYESVVDCFWAMCGHEGSTSEVDVQESYLLARLLPSARNQGSRRIFPDAHLESRAQASTESRMESVRELDSQLSSCREKTLGLVEFRDRTGEVLGPPRLTEEAIGEYETFSTTLLGPASAELAGDESKALERLLERWADFMRSIGRRRGNLLQKQVLDVISYECRAALHRCYSAVWSEMIPELGRRHLLDPESLRFLEFWHLEQVMEASNVEYANFHLFHGHVFALHPATGEFIRTTTGRELVGDWLTHPDGEGPFGRLLHGMYVSTFHYASRRQDIAEQRKKRPPTVAGTDMVELEEGQEARKRGRRGDGKRREDSAS